MDSLGSRSDNEVTTHESELTGTTRDLYATSEFYTLPLGVSDYQCESSFHSIEDSKGGSSSECLESVHGDVGGDGHSEFNDLEKVIRFSKKHWSELRSDGGLDGEAQSNREIFQRLSKLPDYKYFFRSDFSNGDYEKGKKIAEGGQAEIFQGFATVECVNEIPESYYLEGIPGWIFSARLRTPIAKGNDRRSNFRELHGRLSLQGAGYDLRRYEWEEGKPGGLNAILIIYNIAVGMRELHRRNILLRDLKASNVLISDFEDSLKTPGRSIRLRIADFECSMGVVGTAFGRAPEILHQLKADKRKLVDFTGESDVYSFAMTCYEVLTGGIPLEDYLPKDYDVVLSGERPTLPTALSLWIKDLIERCWHPCMSSRPTFEWIVSEIEKHNVIDQSNRRFSLFQ